MFGQGKNREDGKQDKKQYFFLFSSREKTREIENEEKNNPS